MHGVDVVVHAAALKQVPACEYNPMEAVKTNIIGTSNVLEAALDAGVKKVMALSTDKAVSPADLYGGTKLVAEKLVIQSNATLRVRPRATRASATATWSARRGSVVPLFLKQTNGQDHHHRRAHDALRLSLEQGVVSSSTASNRWKAARSSSRKSPARKSLTLRLPSRRMPKWRSSGIRPGEKLHEVLISEDEAGNTIELKDMFVVQPAEAILVWLSVAGQRQGTKEGFYYSSDNNSEWLDVEV